MTNITTVAAAKPAMTARTLRTTVHMMIAPSDCLSYSDERPGRLYDERRDDPRLLSLRLADAALQRLADRDDEFCGAERLLEKERAGLEDLLLEDGFLDVTGGIDGPEIGTLPQELVDRCATPHSRHDEIAQDPVN